MFSRLRTVALAALVVSCGGNESPSPVAPPPPSATAIAGGTLPVISPDASMQTLSRSFLSQLFVLEPTRATLMGEHAYDGAWPDVTPAGEAKSRAFYAETKRMLASIDKSKLSKDELADAMVLENAVDYALFATDELKDLDWDPTAWTTFIGDGLDPLVTRTFETPELRLDHLRARLDGIPALLAVAKQRLKGSPKITTETAITQNEGLIDFCEHTVTELLAKQPSQKAAFDAPLAKATAALKDFGVFLAKELLPRSNGDFRLGRAKFEKKLGFELGETIDVDQIAKDARQLLDQTREEMVQTATELWPRYFKGQTLKAPATPEEKRALVKKVLDKVAEDRPTNATILADATRLLHETTAFVTAHDLVTVPNEPVKVIEMPEYRRGVAVAYCDSSGPLEERPETVFAISPTPKDWPEARALSFYREYNEAMLAELTIHEAMPGHYLQLMHNVKSPSKIRGVFSNGSFVEGWAVYGEWLMAKYGFGGPAVRLQRQKMVLRLTANAILDHGIHAGTMTEKEALDLMMNDAFQEEGEAVGKWKRARLSSAQLTTYYFGFSEMMKLRRDFEGKPGFTERSYHDKLLSFGSPTMKVARTLMHSN